jgi:two-component system nitrate/nitrite response regulator NarL
MADVHELTEREAAVADLLADGQENKEIARNLGISDGRVKQLVRQLCAKLGATNRTDAAVKWMERKRGASGDGGPPQMGLPKKGE